MLILVFFSNIVHSAVCIGNDNDQVVVPFKTLPNIAVSNVPLSIFVGESILLTAEIQSIDAQGIPSFYWCANKGKFVYNTSSPDFKTVTFIAPTTP